MEALTPEEARILGCLVEKERTTPEYYPMTVNALVAAANQKTNRHPVVEYDEPTIERTLRSLDDKGLAGLTRARGGRTLKYLQKAEDAYEVDSDQLAILAVLLLRGPQTPGELRSRTARYFVAEQPLDAIESLLEDLMTRSVPLVERLPREPGQKENRFRNLLTDPATVVPEAAGTPAPVADPLTDRVAVLERRVAALARSLGVEFNDLDQSVE
ncbi:MAG: YceH family protein [Acidimicrobiia bacterium]|nr:YceH family protein [Acidimicrobiia bacterium]